MTLLHNTTDIYGDSAKGGHNCGGLKLNGKAQSGAPISDQSQDTVGLGNRPKPCVVVVFGGRSGEAEVSRRSAQHVLSVLDAITHDLHHVWISSDGLWHFDGDENDGLPPHRAGAYLKEVLGTDLIINLVHGKHGEDGILAGFFEALEISHTGSPVLTDAVCMHKSVAQDLLSTKGVLVPKSVELPTSAGPEELEHAVDAIGGFPCIVKPCTTGSSLGVSIASDNLGVVEAARTAALHGECLLVQEMISGIELSCGVFRIAGQDTPLEPTEIRPEGSFFHFEQKYSSKGVFERTPASISISDRERVMQQALRVHQLMKCRDFSRTDMILCTTGELVVLEVNTIPGMTADSILPQELSASGYEFAECINGLVKERLYTLTSRSRRPKLQGCKNFGRRNHGSHAAQSCC